MNEQRVLEMEAYQCGPTKLIDWEFICVAKGECEEREGERREKVRTTKLQDHFVERTGSHGITATTAVMLSSGARLVCPALTGITQLGPQIRSPPSRAGGQDDGT